MAGGGITTKRWYKYPNQSVELQNMAKVLRTAVNFPEDVPVTPALFPAMQQVLYTQYQRQLIVINKEDNDQIWMVCWRPRPSKEPETIFSVWWKSLLLC